MHNDVRAIPALGQIKIIWDEKGEVQRQRQRAKTVLLSGKGACDMLFVHRMHRGRKHCGNPGCSWKVQEQSGCKGAASQDPGLSWLVCGSGVGHTGPKQLSIQLLDIEPA